MTELLLIRHGETDWNHEKRYQGHKDIPLNEAGIQQAFELAGQLQDPALHNGSLPGSALQAVYSSDLQRAHHTARILAESLKLTPLKDPRLREINHGLWEGMLHSDIQMQYPLEYQRFQEDPGNSSAPGGESIRSLYCRIRSAIGDILDSHPAGRVAVVSHGLALATILAHHHDQSLDRVFDWIPGNAQPVLLTLENVPGTSSTES